MKTDRHLLTPATTTQESPLSADSISLNGSFHQQLQRHTHKKKYFKCSAIALSVCITFTTYTLPGINRFAYAEPTGGVIVGGTGSISNEDLTTIIQQTSDNMAIDWDSYDLAVDETVTYIQPDVDSVSLNSILSADGSVIAGSIESNGTVILINANGLVFTESSVMNVGGIIASGLAIDPADFMNGNYIFNEVVDADGTVINYGLINAATGGQVALLGKEVVNAGLIQANLGSVTLAAGKQAVLTFDNSGLLGVSVTEDILQDEIGIDAAVINSGDITAHGGKVLLTASVSQDVFSQAVNAGDYATSAVVHEDGSFTLGDGADAINTGTINVSADTNVSIDDAGQIVLLGNNVSNSGQLSADNNTGDAGNIELQASNALQLTDDSRVSALSLDGQGGNIHLLGDHVSVSGNTRIIASGDKGGGNILIGGDYQGDNENITNATSTEVGDNVTIEADALLNGDGGTVILWADEDTAFSGSISAKGGSESGDGGFVEVSGKENLAFSGDVDTTAENGETGLLLLDPDNISILNGSQPDPASPEEVETDDDGTIEAEDPGSAPNNISIVYETTLEDLSSTTNISLVANDSIIIEKLADNNLNLSTESGHSVTFTADYDNNNDGDFSMNSGDTISTAGGSVSISGNAITVGSIDTSSTNGAGGAITLDSEAAIEVESLTSRGGIGGLGPGETAGIITLTATTTIDVNGDITAIGGTASSLDSRTGGTGGAISIGSTNETPSVVTIVGSINNSGGTGLNGGAGGNAGSIDVTADSITLGDDITSNGGGESSIQGNGGEITFTGAVVLNDDAIDETDDSLDSADASDDSIVINALGSTAGNVTFTSTVDSESGENNSLTVTGNAVKFGAAVGSIDELSSLTVNASDIEVDAVNTTDAISLTATDNAESGTPSITLNGDINITNTEENALVTLESSDANAEGVVTINHNSAFTSSITIEGAANGSSTLQAGDRTNFWVVDSANAGTLSSDSDLENSEYVTFSHFNSLIGGSGSDEFTISAAIANLSGGAGSDEFSIGTFSDVTGSIDGGSAESLDEGSVDTDTDSVTVTGHKRLKRVSLRILSVHQRQVMVFIH